MPTKNLFEQEAPKIGTQNCSTKRGVREPVHVEFALNNRELVKAEVFEKRVFEQTAPLNEENKSQKKRDVHKISARNSGAGNGRTDFMGAFFLLENPHAHKIPPSRGGVLGFLEGGWKCQFYFYGHGDFSEH